MPIRPVWCNYDPSDDYVSDSQACIKLESLCAIVSTESNRDASIGRKDNYQQEIFELLNFFKVRGEWVRSRFGMSVWKEMMDLASSVTSHMALHRAFLTPIPEKIALDELRRSQFTDRTWQAAPDVWIRSGDVECGGYRFSAAGDGAAVHIQGGDSDKRIDLPEQIWVSDLWRAANTVYVPCRSFCWTTVLLEVDPLQGIVARSSLVQEIDAPPVGYHSDYVYSVS